MPRLWTDTIETHRRDVREAVIATTATLICEHGLLSVTMSRIAEDAGIGRATLYKYFPDVEAILLAWHERQVDAHLDHLVAASRQGGSPLERLRTVLDAYAVMTNESAKHHDTDVAALIHRHDQVGTAEQRLHDLVQGLVADAAANGAIRTDVKPDELTAYCLSALGAAAALPSKAAIRRLVSVTLGGLRDQDGS